VAETHPSVSVVVASIGRIDALETCIAGLLRLEGVTFEVIVVLGPGAEDSIGPMMERSDLGAVVRSPTRNLSMSRNLGVDAAKSEIIAFIDDDAYPSEHWLADLVPAFDDPEIGAVGGETLDYSGVTRQAVTSWCTNAGDSSVRLVPPTPGVSETPGAGAFYYPIGTNLLVRRTALHQIGGFDEQYNYFHDETDLARRLLDAGWIVRPMVQGHVFHKFLPSDIRGPQRIATDRRSILINRAYFAARHQAPDQGPEAVRDGFAAFSAASRSELAIAESDGLIPEGTTRQHDADEAEASSKLETWLISEPSPIIHVEDPATILAAPSAVHHRTLGSLPHIAFIGDETDLVHALVHEGAIARVLELGATHPTVDLEGDVWRHRLAEIPGGGWGDEAKTLGVDLPLLRELSRIEREFWTLDAVVVGPSSAIGADLEARGFPVVDPGELRACGSSGERAELLRATKLRRP
jgi:GT2 family glycosyltransferase